MIFCALSLDMVAGTATLYRAWLQLQLIFNSVVDLRMLLMAVDGLP
jgi:hypothetical protein